LIRVLVADPHAAMRAGVRAALVGTEFTICGEAETAEEAVRLALELSPDLCVVDVAVPGDGLRAIAEIAGRLPRCVVVVLTLTADDASLFAALRAGASGYLLKEITGDTLVSALRGLAAGEVALPQWVVGSMIEEFRGRANRRLVFSRRAGASLTATEWEVLDLIREGMTTSQIADHLLVQPHVVRRSVSSILNKLRVKTRKEALDLIAQRSPM
jgi:DNA-binding NarL/FixJ family response regulator